MNPEPINIIFSIILVLVCMAGIYLLFKSDLNENRKNDIPKRNLAEIHSDPDEAAANDSGNIISHIDEINKIGKI